MYSICLNHALSGYLGYFQFFPVTSHAVCAHLSFYGHYKIAFKKSRYGLQQCMKRKSLHIFTETQQSLLIFVNLAGKKKSLRHFVCYIYLQLSYFNIFDIFICLLITSFCLYLNFLPYFSLLDKTPLRHLEAELDTCPSTLTLFITVGACDAMHCNVYGFFFFLMCLCLK